jgi:hypothetical protein
MSDYLWDRRGPVDGEIAQLERTLAPLQYRRPLELPESSGGSRRYLAVAAAAVIAMLAWQLLRGVPKQATDWRIGDSSPLYSGQRLATGASRLLIEAADFGEVRLEPDSELRIGGRRRMALERGRMHALIWAPPGQFVVDTPSSRAVDLGCQYDLTVDADGNGLLTVETGWVAFQFGKLESFIPAGAACRTRRRTGPGVPYFLDGTPGFMRALEAFESNREGLAAVLREARSKDALSLWHLLTRVSGEDRVKVFERFRSLAPVQVEQERVLALDRNTLDECWNALRLDDAGWWRQWKRDWRP